jgi:outer membrane receptor protein involved in Fe transport
VYREGDALLRRPDLTARAGIAWRPRGALLAADVLHTGARDDMDYGDFPAARVTLPAYTVVNASVDLPLGALRAGWSPHVALVLDARNVLGARYESVVGFPGRGRVVMVGARFQ